MSKTSTYAWLIIVLITHRWVSTRGGLLCCIGICNEKKQSNESYDNVTDSTSSNDGARVLISKKSKHKAPSLISLRTQISSNSPHHDTWEDSVNYNPSYVDSILGDTNPLIPSSESLPIKIANIFEKRRNEIAFEMHNKTKLELSSSSPHRSNSSLLVVLNGRHTIFDSVTDSPEAIAMFRRYDKRSKDKLLVFKSLIYPQIINVIRPGIMQFIDKLMKISTKTKLCVILYLNIDNITRHEQDEIISVMAFIEMYYNQNLQHHQIDQKSDKSFKFELLLIDNTSSKTLAYLSNRIPLISYRKLILIDHEGLDSWDFDAWKDHKFRLCHERIFRQLQNQIVPIQPLAFKLNSYNLTDCFFLRMTAMIGDDIESKAFLHQFKTDFATHWLQFEHKNIIRVMSDKFELSFSQRLSFSKREMQLMDAETPAMEQRRDSNSLTYDMSVELCSTIQSMQAQSHSIRNGGDPRSPHKLHTGMLWTKSKQTKH